MNAEISALKFIMVLMYINCACVLCMCFVCVHSMYVCCVCVCGGGPQWRKASYYHVPRFPQMG